MTAYTDPGTSTWGIAWQQSHVDYLEARGVDRAVAADRGYRQVADRVQLERAGYSKSVPRPGLLIPLLNVHGNSAGYQYRPDTPKPGRPKFESPSGQRMVIDFPKATIGHLGDPDVDLWITEGPVKADAAVSAGLCCIALLGVYGFRHRNRDGGKTIHPDFEHVAWNGRRVVLAFDADSTSNVKVYDALNRLGGYLVSLGAIVEYLHVPDLGDGKTGIDDYLASGHTVAELETLTSPNLGDRPVPPATEDVGTDGHHFTDLGNAQRLIDLHGERVRYVAGWGLWIVWTGQRYEVDTGDIVISRLAADVARSMFQAAAADGVDTSTRDKQIRWAKRSESAAAIGAMTKLARSVSGVAIAHDELDTDHHLLNVENGVIDLATGRLLPHSPDRLITKMAPVTYDPEATAPTWHAFLDEVLPDRAVQDYVRRGVGYSLSGDVTEQVLFISTGVGANGKSTFVAPIITMLGDYAVNAPKDLLLATKHEPHPTSMTQLFGARFALAMETEAGAKLAEAQVKQLTGGDQITARRMREDFWTFDPTHKLWLGCNHLPKIHGRDHAIWRRIRVIPFDVVIPADDQDHQLPAKLADELPGILNWALRGHAEWIDHGLETPAAVVTATDNYRTESDWVNRFFADFGYQLTPGFGAIPTSQLREDLEKWCRDEGVSIGRKQFADALEAVGCVSGKSGSSRYWKGLQREV